MDIELTTPGSPETATSPDSSVERTRRIWLPFHFTLGAALVLIVFIFNSHNVSDPDIWWHLNDAQQVLHGHFPRVDNFSWTATGSPWMDHEWVAEIPFYLAYKAFGLRGLYGFSFFLASAVLVLILTRASKVTGDAKNAFTVAVFCVLLTVVSYGPRMLLFGWIYMLTMLMALDAFRKGATKAIWILPPLFLLWVNSHGSWMIGLVVFFLVAASGFVQFEIGNVEAQRWTKDQMRWLAIVGLLCIVALFINPYGYKLVTYPFDMAFHQQLNIEHVEEWASVDFHNARGKVVFLTVAAIIACLVSSRKKLLLAELLLLLLGMYSGLTYIRFLFLLAILASPFLSARIRLFPPYDPKIDKPWLNLAFMLVVIGIIVWRFPSEAKLNADLEKQFPAKSIAYLQQHNIRDRVLTHYLWGGYIERFAPEVPVFVDSRVDIFEYNGTLKDYLDLIGLKEPLAILDRRQIQYVYFKPDDHLVYLLRHTGGWDVLYQDQNSILLKRH
jgi:hypothetical protein